MTLVIEQGHYVVTRNGIFKGNKKILDGPLYFGSVKPYLDGLEHFYLMKDGEYIEFEDGSEVDFDMEYELYFKNEVPQSQPSTVNIQIGEEGSIRNNSVIYQGRKPYLTLTYTKGKFIPTEYHPTLEIKEKLLTVNVYPSTDVNSLVKEISKLYIKGKISYPFKRYTNEFPPFSDIENYHNEFDGSQSSITDIDDYHLNIFTDYYTEPQRLEAQVYGSIKPIDALKDPSIVKKLLNVGEILSPYLMRERLRENVREATQFKVCLAKAVIDVYCKNGTYLDMSMGWGDRLVAALASPVKKYIGFDPNESLHDSYVQMSQLNPKVETHFHTLPFQDLGYRNVDLAFTSPPFFDFEIYSKDQGQSIVGTSTYKDWTETFYYPMMNDAWASLKEAGKMILYIGNTFRTSTLVEDAISFMKPRSKVRQIFINKKISLYVWTKGYLNPPFVVEEYKPTTKLLDSVMSEKWSDQVYKKMIKSGTVTDGRSVKGIDRSFKPTITVVNDAVLEAGTKQRGWKFIKNIGSNFYLVSTPHGYGQIVAAMLGKQFGYKVRIYIERLDKLTSLTIRAMDYGAEVIEVTGKDVSKEGLRKDGGPKISAIQEYADEREKDSEYIKLPFGLESEEFIEELAKSFKLADDKKVLKNAKNIWVAAGSGTIAKALRLAFPKPHLNLVRIGREVEKVENSTVWSVNGYRKFSDQVRKEEIPPYKSLINYDAKVWVPAVVVSWYNKDRREDTVIFNIA